MKLVVPELPSFAVASPIVSVGRASSLVIVPVPMPVPAMVAFDGFDEVHRERLVRLDRRVAVDRDDDLLRGLAGAKVSVPEAAV